MKCETDIQIFLQCWPFESQIIVLLGRHHFVSYRGDALVSVGAQVAPAYRTCMYFKSKRSPVWELCSVTLGKVGTVASMPKKSDLYSVRPTIPHLVCPTVRLAQTNKQTNTNHRWKTYTHPLSIIPIHSRPKTPSCQPQSHPSTTQRHHPTRR